METVANEVRKGVLYCDFFIIGGTMIEEVLIAVKKAEEKAEKKISNAKLKADEIKASADEKAKELKKSAEESIKAERNEILKNAKLSADNGFYLGIEKTDADCKKLVADKKDEVEKLSAELFGRILNGDC